MPLCLNCRLGYVHAPHAGVGLCVSCAFMLKDGDVEIVDTPETGRVIRCVPADERHPLRCEHPDAGRPYYPERLFRQHPDDARELADRLAEFVVSLGLWAERRATARQLMTRLDKYKVGYVLEGDGYARIDRPGDVPYRLLDLYAKYAYEIGDILSAPLKEPYAALCSLLEPKGQQTPRAVLELLLHAGY